MVGASQREGFTVNGKKEGKWISWCGNNGFQIPRIRYVSNYNCDKLNGLERTLHSNGSPYKEEMYQNGSFIGISKVWNEDGKLIMISDETRDKTYSIYD